MYTVTIQQVICSSHSLPGEQGRPGPLHGHNLRVVAELECCELDARGRVIGQAKASRALWAVLEPLDHHHLNDVPPFDAPDAPPPTPPALARYVAEALATLLDDDRVRVREVSVSSTAERSAAWVC